jgi:hypothetical protein
MGAGELARAPMKSCFSVVQVVFITKGGSVKNRDAPGFCRIDRIFLILNPVNHDNPVILSKKHGSYPHLHSRAERGRRAARPK